MLTSFKISYGERTRKEYVSKFCARGERQSKFHFHFAMNYFYHVRGCVLRNDTRCDNFISKTHFLSYFWRLRIRERDKQFIFLSDLHQVRIFGRMRACVPFLNFFEDKSKNSEGEEKRKLNVYAKYGRENIRFLGAQN